MVDIIYTKRAQQSLIVPIFCFMITKSSNALNMVGVPITTVQGGVSMAETVWLS